MVTKCIPFWSAVAIAAIGLTFFIPLLVFSIQAAHRGDTIMETLYCEGALYLAVIFVIFLVSIALVIFIMEMRDRKRGLQ